jgi:hypothetical protein
MKTITTEVVDLAGTEVLAQTINPVDLFTGDALDIVLAEIKKQALAVGNDISTAKSRAEIISMSAKVATSGVQIDKWGFGLTEGWRKETKRVNDSRRKAKDFIKAVKTETRQPVTDWEQAEKDRIAFLEMCVGRIEYFKDICETPDPNSEQLQKWLDDLMEITIDETWQEFQEEAQIKYDANIALISSRLESRKKYESEQAELQKLREEQAAREKIEYEQRLKDEAVAQAKKEAEEKAEKERLASLQREQAAKDAQAKAEREKIAAQERAKAQAAQAKKDAREAAERAEKEKKEAAEKAEREKREAVAEAERKAKAEADRLELERKVKEEADRIQAEARAADEKHRLTIKREIIDCLLGAGLQMEQTESLFNLLDSGRIKHVSIKY